jgi:hypothetical protein
MRGGSADHTFGTSALFYPEPNMNKCHVHGVTGVNVVLLLLHLLVRNWKFNFIHICKISKKQKASAACNKEYDSAADRIKLPSATRQTVTQKKLRFQDNHCPLPSMLKLT